MKVSIIVTAYNIGKYLEKCLQSLLKTSPYISEIICVDDGSTDNSYAIICKYKKIDPRIIAIHKENGGISSARNKGIQIASGDFLIFVDGDDYIDADILNSLLDKYNFIGDYMNNVNMGFILTIIAGLSTMLGTIFIFIKKKSEISLLLH